MARRQSTPKTIALEEILHDWRKTERGPKPRLSEIQLFSALHLINEHAPLGRYELAERMRENQGVIRGLLERLLDRNLIASTKAGARVTEEGRKVLKSYMTRHKIAELKKVEIPSLISAPYTYGAHLRQTSNITSKMIEQRDAAVRMGADGALTILYTKRGFAIPPDNESLSRLYPEAAMVLESNFPSKDGEVVLLSFAKEEYAALTGVLAASFSISA